MMNYNEFKEKTVAEFKKYLPEKYKNLDLEVRTVEKTNRTLECINLIGDGRTVIPSLYIEDMYQSYVDCGYFPQAMTECAVIMVEAIEKAPQITSKDILESKDKIIYQLVNTEWNKEMLEKVPHREFLDLSIINRALIGQVETELYGAVINHALAEKMGLSEEQLYVLAKENAERILPVSCMKIEDLLHVDELTAMYVVTNKVSVNGAASMLYENVLHSLAEKLESNLYILPSSTHEILVVPVAEVEANVLVEMVKKINAEDVRPEERLSNSVYHYDRATGEITLAAE